MRITEDPPREGILLAQRFLADNPSLEALQAELQRLADNQNQRPYEDSEISEWLRSQAGADYRMALNAEDTRRRAEANRAALLAKRAADAAALEAERQAEASLTIEQRIERLEKAAKHRGWQL